MSFDCKHSNLASQWNIYQEKQIQVITTPQHSVSLEEQEKNYRKIVPVTNWGMYVNKIITIDLPDAVTLEMIQKTTKKDKTM